VLSGAAADDTFPTYKYDRETAPAIACSGTIVTGEPKPENSFKNAVSG